MSIIAAGTTSNTALVNTGNTDGTLQLRVNGTTPSVTLATTGAIGVGSTPGYGTNGQVLTSSGSSAAPTWTTVGATPAGSNTQVQFNNSGAFGASANFTFDGTRLTTTAITSSGVTNSFGPATNASAAHLFSGTKTGYSMVTVDSCTLSPPATSDAAIIFVQPAVGNTIQKASSATHTNFAALYVAPPAIGAGLAALTNASAIYVPSAPSGATNNYAISVGSGTTYLNGLVDISGASGGQIKFPATQNASSDANTLDDYEEGTWTPTVTLNTGTGTNYTINTATYTKTGRVVVVIGSIIPTNGTFGSTNGYARMTGLPFTCAARVGTGAGGNSSALSAAGATTFAYSTTLDVAFVSGVVSTNEFAFTATYFV